MRRAGDLDDEGVAVRLGLLSDLDILRLPITGRLLTTAWSLRDTIAMRDALYVAAAMQLDGLVLTSDQRLRRASPWLTTSDGDPYRMGPAVWLGGMKTTIDLADDLMAAVRQRARERGVTMREVIEDALRRSLSAPPPPSYRLELPVTAGRRAPTIDVDSNAEIDAYLDADDARR